jgi:hypothetical protein
MKENDMIKKALEENYVEMYNISKEKQKKLIKLWTMRACRFFVEGELDSLTVEEDSDNDNLIYGLDHEKKEIEKY